MKALFGRARGHLIRRAVRSTIALVEGETMSLFRAAISAAFAASLFACDHHVDVAGPAGVPYACADGRSARIFFDGGDPNRLPARLEIDGRQIVLQPAPAMSGLRYASEDGLVWWSEGDEARLSEAGPDGGERELVRCARVREGETALPADEKHKSGH